jgi:hypothetical protein
MKSVQLPTERDINQSATCELSSKNLFIDFPRNRYFKHLFLWPKNPQILLTPNISEADLQPAETVLKINFHIWLFRNIHNGTVDPQLLFMMDEV